MFRANRRNAALSGLKSLVLSACIALTAGHAFACTGIIFSSADGAIVPARTLEFGVDVQSDLYAVPPGTEFTTLQANPDETGFTYTTKYGFLGANAFDYPIIVDGMNTEGLYFGIFYFAGDAIFGDVSDENRDRAVSSEELGNWILGQFKTVEEVREALSTIELIGSHIDVIDSYAPVHYTVVDASGAAIVIEQTDNGLRIFDNTVGVITNNPTYDWHLTNLRNYLNLRPENRDPITVGSEILAGFGEGTGMLGLPGDFTSPSRFVRAVAFKETILPTETAAETIFQAFHVLNMFDIPKGAVRAPTPEGVHTDYTVWTSAADTQNGVYHFKTYKSQTVQSVNIEQALDGLTEPKFVPSEIGDFVINDRTGDF